MAELKTMYPGVANSPETFLKEALTIDGTIMYLADGSVLGEIPTLAVIGEGQQAETVLVVSTRSDGGFVINRGVEGPKKAWTKATAVARNWTNKDYETLRANITAINADVETKVDKIDGKGLSTNDYDDAAKMKVDGIPANPKYTDTVADLTPYAKKTDVPTKLSQLSEDSTHRLVTDTEKAKVQAIPANPKYTDTVPDLSPYAKKTDIPDLAPYAKTTDLPDLTPYAKKIDIKTRLADMEGDSEHRTVTDAEKKAWSEGGGIDEQYLYDILMGESLVTRKAGEWPKVHGKPTTIDKWAFQGYKLTAVTIPSSVITIMEEAFRFNELTSVIIPPSVTTIDKSAFRDNKLISVIIPPSVTSIGSRAFYNNQLAEAKVPKNCTVASGAFDDGVNIVRY